MHFVHHWQQAANAAAEESGGGGSLPWKLKTLHSGAASPQSLRLPGRAKWNPAS